MRPAVSLDRIDLDKVGAFASTAAEVDSATGACTAAR